MNKIVAKVRKDIRIEQGRREEKGAFYRHRR